MQHHAEPVFKLCRTYVKKIYTYLPLLDKTLPDNLVVMKNEITKSIGTLIFRVALGFTFVMHGFQKAFLIGPAAEGAAFAKMGIPAPELSAYFTIGAELIGGALLILGLGTRFAAAPSQSLWQVLLFLFTSTTPSSPIRRPAQASSTFSSWAWQLSCSF